MKKGFVLILIFILIIGLVACDNDTSTKTQTTSLPTLNIGIDAYFPPYTFTNSDIGYTGFDVEVAKEACARMGYTPNFCALEWSDIDQYLKNDDIQCVWSCLAVDNTSESMIFTTSYLYTKSSFIVLNSSTYQTVDSLQGCSIAVQNGSHSYSYIINHPTFGTKDYFKTIYSLPDIDNEFIVLNNGLADAIFSEHGAALYKMNQYPNKYRVISSTSPYSVGVGVKRGNTVLRDKLNTVLVEMIMDGTMYNIAEKWGLESMVVRGGSY